MIKYQHYVTKCFLLGELAGCIVQQSPYLPENLSEIIRAADKYIDDHPFTEEISAIADTTIYGYEDDVLRKFLDTMCHELPEIKVLNLSRLEIESGFTVNDVDDNEKRERWERVYLSRIDTIPKQRDFVSLGALANNIFRAVQRDVQITDNIIIQCSLTASP